MKLASILSLDLSYCDPALKARFHSVARKRLTEVAEALGLPRDEFDVRSNKGGIAVSGEVTLHTDTLYVQVCQSFMGRGSDVMYRTCKGRRDYGGGPNHFCTAGELDFPEEFANNRLKKLLLGSPIR